MDKLNQLISDTKARCDANMATDKKINAEVTERQERMNQIQAMLLEDQGALKALGSLRNEEVAEESE